MSSNLDKELDIRLVQNSKNSYEPPSNNIFKKERDRKTSCSKNEGQTGMDGNDARCIDNGIGGLESRANVRVSFLFLVTLLSFLYIKKRKKGSKNFDIKEKFYLKK